MMATTHTLAGVLLAVAVMTVVPELGILPVLAAAFGGLFPDLDLYANHRKMLHFPVYYSAGAVLAGAVAAVVPTALTVAIALFLAAAALHSVMDAAGGGLELKPWLGTSDRAVYSHFHGRWVAPRRWIRYDGAPEDLALAVWFGVPSILVLDGTLELGVWLALAVSAVYVLLRKPLVTFAERLVTSLPTSVVHRLPDRFVRDFQ